MIALIVLWGCYNDCLSSGLYLFAFWLLPLVRVWCWFCFALCLISLTWWFAVCVNSVVTIA